MFFQLDEIGLNLFHLNLTPEIFLQNPNLIFKK